MLLSQVCLNVLLGVTNAQVAAGALSAFDCKGTFEQALIKLSQIC